jgi:hypothetical protein
MFRFFVGNNCANFVSQAINMAGILQEPRWTYWGPNNEPTSTWWNTGIRITWGGLLCYMYEQGFFFPSSDRRRAFAGSIIHWAPTSHVGMVCGNDTVTMTFSAHTANRRAQSFRDWGGIAFYIPTFDSVAWRWTPR